MPVPATKQLKLTPKDAERLRSTIEQDYQDDSADFAARNSAMKRWYKLWRNSMDSLGFPDHERTNFSIPLCMWVIKAMLAKELEALFGEDSEIVVTPVGETDATRQPKVKKWMNWRIKQSLKLYAKLYDYILQKRVFGTTIGYLPWVTKTRTIKKLFSEPQPDIPVESKHPITGLPMLTMQPQKPLMIEKDVEVIDYDGPELFVENLEDWIFPANAKSIEEVNHFIRKLRLSTDEILDMVEQGKFSKKVKEEEIWEKLIHLAENEHPDQNSSIAGEEITAEKKAQDGLPQIPTGREEKVIVHNWFGRIRLGVKEDGTGGDQRTTEVVAFYQPDIHEILGVCRLVDIFPDGRRPFILSQAVRDVNKIWGIGDCETLEPISREMDALHGLAMDAGAGSIGPVIFYTPGGGYNPEKHKIEPWTAIPCADPNTVKTVNLGQINLGPYMLLDQKLLGFSERVTGITDPQMGRQFSQPNAPRTLGQQQILQGESSTLMLLGIRLERETMRDLFQRIWEMDKRWLPKPVFFRVTEEDPSDVLTEEDMQGDYDFDIGPVTMTSNRGQRLQESMQALMLLQQSNMPPAYASLLKKIITKLGHPDVAKFIPDMEKMKPPDSPEEENTRLLQGETAHVHPMDQHQQHIAIHEDLAARVEASVIALPNGTQVEAESMNPGVVGRIRAHIAEHQQAMKQGIMGGAMQQLGAGTPAVQPAQQQNQNMGAPPDLMANLRNMLGSAMNTGGPLG